MSAVKSEIPASASGTTYEQMRQMMSYMSGDNNRASTSASALESIKLISQLDKMEKESGGMSDSMKSVYAFEKAYLEAGIKAVSTNQQLGDKFGRGLEGANILAQFMKQLNSEEQAKSMVRGFLPSTGQYRSADQSALHGSRESALASLSGGGGGGGGGSA